MATWIRPKQIMNTNTGSWKFDQNIAQIFVDHARQHIPNYDTVIDKCVQVCQTVDKTSRIIDVGCATGETIRRLAAQGFDNLTGVDSSLDMLAHCDPALARYLHSNTFPKETFDVVLFNWTLHFVADKIKYLSDIYENLSDNGILVVSDKTSLDPEMIKFYHSWKHARGVSWADIDKKQNAVKGIMHIDSPQWYMTTLNSLGFQNIQIIDASWCFTTFICKK